MDSKDELLLLWLWLLVVEAFPPTAPPTTTLSVLGMSSRLRDVTGAPDDLLDFHPSTLNPVAWSCPNKT
jgi:hypothetical protein